MIQEHYPSGRAPKEATPIVLGYLREYVKRFPSQRKAVVDLLGCSESSAKRLLSRSKPYTARIRKEWVVMICNAVGVPPVRVLGPKGERMFPNATLGWLQAKSRTQAMEMATDCAASIAIRAYVHYGLSGHYSITYPHGWVSEVVIYLSPVPELTIEGGDKGYHRISITSRKDSDGVRRMWIQHIDPATGCVTDKEILEPKYLESLIKNVYTITRPLTKNLRPDRV